METTITAAARIIGMSRQNIWLLVKDGKIPARRAAKTWLVEIEAVRTYFRDKAKDQVIAGFSEFIKYSTQEQVEILAGVIQRAAEGKGGDKNEANASPAAGTGKVD